MGKDFQMISFKILNLYFFFSFFYYFELTTLGIITTVSTMPSKQREYSTQTNRLKRKYHAVNKKNKYFFLIVFFF